MLVKTSWGQGHRPCCVGTSHSKEKHQATHVGSGRREEAKLIGGYCGGGGTRRNSCNRAEQNLDLENHHNSHRVPTGARAVSTSPAATYTRRLPKALPEELRRLPRGSNVGSTSKLGAAELPDSSAPKQGPAEPHQSPPGHNVRGRLQRSAGTRVSVRRSQAEHSLRPAAGCS